MVLACGYLSSHTGAVPFASVNGVRIHYHVHGDGPPLVLAHGHTATLDMWSEQVEAFAARYRLVLFDARGHGESEAPADPASYSMDAYAEDLRCLLDHLGIERAFVGGLSMGGMVALQFALTYPQRVRALLLCDTSAGYGFVDAIGERERWDGFRDRLLRLAQTEGMAAVAGATRENAAGALAPGQRFPEGVERHLERLSKMALAGYLGSARALRERPDLEPRLGELRAPTLVLCGEHDVFLTPSVAMHDAIAGSRFVLVRGAWHGTAAWRPDAFAGAVLAFLADVEAGRPVAGEWCV